MLELFFFSLHKIVLTTAAFVQTTFSPFLYTLLTGDFLWLGAVGKFREKKNLIKRVYRNRS